MNTKIAAAILVIGLISTMSGVATYAYFSDTETSKGNIFVAGTLDLKVSHSSNGPWTDAVSETWSLSNMKPGDEGQTASVFFKNFGSVSSTTITITCDYSVTEESPQTESDTDPNTDMHPDEMAKYMIATMLRYRNDQVDIDCLTGYDSYSGQTKDDWKLNDANGDEMISLYDLKLDPLINLPSPDTQPNKVTQIDMRIKFDESAGNDLQGDTFDLTMMFTLNQ